MRSPYSATGEWPLLSATRAKVHVCSNKDSEWEKNKIKNKETELGPGLVHSGATGFIEPPHDSFHGL